MESESIGLIYSVSVVLPEEALDEALRYMRSKHINDVLKHPAFSVANFFLDLDDEQKPVGFTTHYYVTDVDSFKRYQESDSRPLKGDFIYHLGKWEPKVSRALLADEGHFQSKD